MSLWESLKYEAWWLSETIPRIDPPVEPDTGPKAENHRPAYVKAKAAIAEARKKTSAATQEEA